MLKEIFPHLFRVRFPLPSMPMGHVNSYIIRGSGHNLIVDTGHDQPDCLKVMKDAIDRLKLDLNQTDFLITHFHSDHNGLVTAFASPKAKVYLSREDAEFISTWTGFEQMIAFAGKSGFPMDALRHYLDTHKEWDLNFNDTANFIPMDDGDSIRVGEDRFTCLLTSGHTMGHICLHDAKRKVLISGDHIHSGSIPTLPCWQEGGNPLKFYFESLQRVSDMDLHLVLPGHGPAVEDYRSLIQKITAYHAKRTGKIFDSLSQAPLTAYEIARMQQWGGSVKSWEDFPALHQWVATGETIAYLHYLLQKGDIQSIFDGETVRFFRSTLTGTKKPLPPVLRKARVPAKHQALHLYQRSLSKILFPKVCFIVLLRDVLAL